MDIYSTDSLLKWQPPSEPMYIGAGLLYQATTMFIYGRFGTFKSLLAMYLAICLSSGIPWLNFSTTPARVLLINTEIPQFLYRKRIEKYAANDQRALNDNMFWATELNFKLDHPNTLNDFITVLKNYRPNVVILDPYYKAISGNISDPTEMQKIIDRLDKLKNDYSFALVLVGHTRKTRQDGVVDWGQELMGASNIVNAADTLIAIEPMTKKSIKLHFEKARNATEELVDMEVFLDRDTLKFMV